MIRLKFILFIFLAFLITLFGLKYRLRQYTDYPTLHDSFDEIGYLWLGKSLVNSGIPANWSALPIYSQYLGQTQSEIQGFNLYSDISNSPLPLVKSVENTFPDNYKSQFLYVQPYLDNPPLAGLIFSLIDKQTSFFNPTAQHIRLVPVFLTSLTIFLLVLLGIRLFSFQVAIISALIYALGPGFILSSRMALPENILSFLFVLSLLIIHKYISENHFYYLVLGCLFCFFAVWLKVSGLIIGGSLALIAFQVHKNKAGLSLVTASLLGLLSYFVYGLVHNASLFLKMLEVQGSRAFAGPASIFTQLLHPHVPVSLFDGWIILAYILYFSLLLISSKYIKNTKYLTTSLGVYLVFFTLFGGFNFPWYQFIVYPLLALTLGVVIDHFIEFPRWEFNLLFFLVVVSSFLHYRFYTSSWITFLNPFRLLFLGPVVLGILIRKKLILNTSLFIMMVYALNLGIYIINHLNYYWPLLSLNRI